MTWLVSLSGGVEPSWPLLYGLGPQTKTQGDVGPKHRTVSQANRLLGAELVTVRQRVPAPPAKNEHCDCSIRPTWRRGVKRPEGKEEQKWGGGRWKGSIGGWGTRRGAGRGWGGQGRRTSKEENEEYNAERRKLEKGSETKELCLFRGKKNRMNKGKVRAVSMQVGVVRVRQGKECCRVSM